MASWNRARFIVNTTTIPYLMSRKPLNATPIYQPNALISQAMQPSIIGQSSVDNAALVTRPQGTLLGFPVYVSEKVPVLGSPGDVSLVDPSQYGYAKRHGLKLGYLSTSCSIPIRSRTGLSFGMTRNLGAALSTGGWFVHQSLTVHPVELKGA